VSDIAAQENIGIQVNCGSDRRRPETLKMTLAV